jgi:hypothetical protein
MYHLSRELVANSTKSLFIPSSVAAAVVKSMGYCSKYGKFVNGLC